MPIPAPSTPAPSIPARSSVGGFIVGGSSVGGSSVGEPIPGAQRPGSSGASADQEPAWLQPLDQDQALILLRALADPIRLQLVEALARGERCVCELTAELALAQSKLSFHLKVLRQAGLISSRQQGRWMYYRLDPNALGALRDWLAARSIAGLVPAAACCGELI